MFLSVEDIKERMKVSTKMGYRILRALNKELAYQGYIIIADRVPKKYFMSPTMFYSI